MDLIRYYVCSVRYDLFAGILLANVTGYLFVKFNPELLMWE